MRTGGVGGGNTRSGLLFEDDVDLLEFLSGQEGYEVREVRARGVRVKNVENEVFYNGERVARIFKKHAFYRFLEEQGINWQEHISGQIFPDNSIYVITRNTLYIIECKYQQGAGSVDEKLQTCDFKKKEYQKLLESTNIQVQYMYVLNDWFRQRKYEDVLQYIRNVGCQYYFVGDITLENFGLPVPPESTAE